MKDIINILKISATWKIQLRAAVNFNSSKDIDEECLMHSKSDNLEVVIYDKADEAIKELFFFHLFLDIKLGWKHQWMAKI